MTKRYVIADTDVLNKLIAAEETAGCSLSPDVLPRLFGSPILTPAASAHELTVFSSIAAAKTFAANPPTWLLVRQPTSTSLGPLAEQFTHNACDVELLALVLHLSQGPAEVLVLTDNTDLHKALRQLEPGISARVSVAPFEAILAYAAERRLITALQGEMDALKANRIHRPAALTDSKLRQLHVYLEETRLQAVQGQPDEAALIEEAKSIQSLMATMGLRDPDEEDPVGSLRAYYENGGRAARAEESDRAHRIADQQGRDWLDVMSELRRAEVKTLWATADEIAQRTGRKSAEVFRELRREDDRQKAKKVAVN